MDSNHSFLNPGAMTSLHELRERMPKLHPYAALSLTLEPMLIGGEITSDEYLQIAAWMLAAQNKPLFTQN